MVWLIVKFIYFSLLSLLVLTLSACNSSDIQSPSLNTSNRATDIEQSNKANTYTDSEDNAVDSKNQSSKPESSTKHKNSNDKIYKHAFINADSLIFHDLFYLRNEGISYTLDQVEVGKDIPQGEYIVAYYEGRMPYWNVIINGVKHEDIGRGLALMQVNLKDGYIIEAEGFSFIYKKHFEEKYDYFQKTYPSQMPPEVIDLETL